MPESGVSSVYAIYHLTTTCKAWSFIISSLKKKKKKKLGKTVMAQWKRIWLGTVRSRIRSLASLSGLRIWHCYEPWCRPAAIALIRSLAWEPPIRCGCGPKKKKKIFFFNYGWITTLCQLLPYSKVTQSYIHIYIHTYTHTFFFSHSFPSCYPLFSDEWTEPHRSKLACPQSSNHGGRSTDSNPSLLSPEIDHNR